MYFISRLLENIPEKQPRKALQEKQKKIQKWKSGPQGLLQGARKKSSMRSFEATDAGRRPRIESIKSSIEFVKRSPGATNKLKGSFYPCP